MAIVWVVLALFGVLVLLLLAVAVVSLRVDESALGDFGSGALRLQPASASAATAMEASA